MEKNNLIDINIEEDFGWGFTAIDENEIMEDNMTFSSLQEELNDAKRRLKSIEKMILPLLQNLSKDPDKPMIKWPNRKEILDKQTKRFLELTRT